MTISQTVQEFRADKQTPTNKQTNTTENYATAVLVVILMNGGDAIRGALLYSLKF